MALLWAITTPLQWLCAPFWTLITILPTALQLAAAVTVLWLACLAAKNFLSKAQVRDCVDQPYVPTKQSLIPFKNQQPSNARANKTSIVSSVLKVSYSHVN